MPATATAKSVLARYRTGMLTDAELQAAFLAARGFGKILDDEILVSILRAVAELSPANR